MNMCNAKRKFFQRIWTILNNIWNVYFIYIYIYILFALSVLSLCVFCSFCSIMQKHSIFAQPWNVYQIQDPISVCFIYQGKSQNLTNNGLECLFLFQTKSSGTCKLFIVTIHIKRRTLKRWRITRQLKKWMRKEDRKLNSNFIKLH